VAFGVGLVAGAVLVVTAPRAGARVLCAVYVVTLVAMFGASALFHRARWRSERTRARARTADHLAALIVIAGTYTPIVGLGMDGRSRVLILVAVWTGVALGAVVELAPGEPHRAALAAIYVAVGSIIALDFGGLADHVGAASVAFVAVGGVLYVLGAVVYAGKRPDPWPAWFGFHEVFHALVVGGATAHFVAVARIAGAS
jgi:hemolysin III